MSPPSPASHWVAIGTKEVKRAEAPVTVATSLCTFLAQEHSRASQQVAVRVRSETHGRLMAAHRMRCNPHVVRQRVKLPTTQAPPLQPPSPPAPPAAPPHRCSVTGDRTDGLKGKPARRKRGGKKNCFHQNGAWHMCRASKQQQTHKTSRYRIQALSTSRGAVRTERRRESEMGNSREERMGR